MSKKIVVGIDFSKDSLNALEHAMTIAQRGKMSLTMVWVDHLDYSKEIFNIDPSHRLNVVTNKFNDIIKKYSEKCSQLDFVIRKGKVYKEICSVADEAKAFLVVIGTHGLSGFEEFWSGSNANRIVAACNVPVVSIRGGVNVDKNLERIVLPLDSTKTTREKIPITAELAKYFDSEIHILGLQTSDYSDIKFRVKDYVLQAEDFFKENNIKYKSVIIESKQITDDTIDYAEKINANLISIMTEQEISTANLWLGPYAVQMVNHSPIPVLSVKPNEMLFI